MKLFKTSSSPTHAFKTISIFQITQNEDLNRWLCVLTITKNEFELGLNASISRHALFHLAITLGTRTLWFQLFSKD